MLKIWQSCRCGPVVAHHQFLSVFRFFRGIQRWHWLCSWSCFQSFCLDPRGGTLPLSIRLPSLLPFSPTGPRCIPSPLKTLMAMAMATWQVWETVDTSEDSRGGWIFMVAPQGWARHWSTFPLLVLTPSGSLPYLPHPWQTLATTSRTIGGGFKSARMPSSDNIRLYSEWVA